MYPDRRLNSNHSSKVSALSACETVALLSMAQRGKRRREDSEDARESRKVARARLLAEEERALTSVLFGRTSEAASAEPDSAWFIGRNMVGEASEHELSAEDKDDELVPASDSDLEVQDSGSSNDEDEEDEEEEVETALRPAWHDDDDAQLNVALVGVSQRRLKLRRNPDERHVDARAYTERLRTQHALLARNDAHWALLPEQRSALSQDVASLEDSEEEVDEAGADDVGASTARTLSSAHSTRLEPGRLLIGRVHDVTSAEQARGVVRAVDWHAGGEVVCVASLDRTLRLFALGADDSEAPSKLQSVRLADLPLTHAAFTRDGNAVVCSGAARHFYVYDVRGGVLERVAALTGRAHDDAKLTHLALASDLDAFAFADARGRVQLVSQRSRQWLCELQCGSVSLSALSVRDSTLLCATREGDVLEWDLRMRRCVSRWRDHGATHTTALSASAQWLATGSDVGVVNLYRTPLSGSESARNRALTATPTPHKTLLNLTTEITALAFNTDAQLLAMASQHKSNALRFVHLPSATVFSNFPKQNTPLSRVTALAFSPSSAHVAIGTARGKVLLYRLHHYRAHPANAAERREVAETRT